MTETWTPAYGWHNYDVSSEGRIQRVVGGRGCRVGHIMSQRINRDGYACVTLYRNNTKRGYLVSRVVCASFHGPPPTDSHHAAHTDGDKLNNRPGNLRWATQEENEADKIGHGTRLRGEAMVISKLTDDQVRAIRADTRRQHTIALDFGVTQSLISMVKSKKVWAHV